MKKALLLLFITTSISAISQNQAPIAVNDSLHYSYEDVHTNDSLNIGIGTLLINDHDPDGNLIRIEDIIYSGSNHITVFKPLTHVYNIFFDAQPDFSGVDSFQYIIVDLGNPSKRDTATATIIVAPIAHAYLEANNIRTSISSEALFSAPNHDHQGFEAPTGSGLFSIFAANLIVAGTNNGIAYSNARMFGAYSNSNFSPKYTSNPGPVSNSSHSGPMLNSHWDRVWKVSKHQIEWHLDNYRNPGYTAPVEILEWPTHGIIIKGEPQFLAPYFDQNNDSLYDPYDGDYPIIKGDEAIYFIYNDGNSPFSTNPMISEVHGMAYAYTCQDSALQNTIFVDYRVINRSTKTYENTHFGMWVDIDLGNIQDDYVGCDVMRNCFYGYNGNDNDQQNPFNNGYGLHPSSIGTILLQGPKQDDDGIDNDFGINPNESVNGIGFGDGISDNEYWGLEYNQVLNNTFPYLSTDLGFYQNISGLDPSNNPWSRSINGSSSIIPYKYLYPGNSDSLNYGTFGIPIGNWSEITDANAPGDRFNLGSTGNVTFKPGDEVNLSYAFVFGRDYVNTGAQAGVTNMLERVDSIRSYFANGSLSPCGFPLSTKETATSSNNITIYPNPAKDQINILMEGLSDYKIQLIDVSGKLIINETSLQPHLTIPVSDFPKGIYFIKIMTETETTVRKVIIQ